MYFFSLIGIGLFLLSHTLYADSMARKIELAIDKELPAATVSIFVKDAKNGQPIFSKNANKLMYPASNIKLFTAAAAFYYWAPSHQFKTKLLRDKKNYYIQFGGSPSLTKNNLDSLLIKYLKNNHINTVDGHLVFDTSLFSPPYYPSGVSLDDLGWYYAAPDTAIILNRNAASYELISASKLGDLATIKPKKKDNPLNISNAVRTVSAKEAREHCNLNVEIKPQNNIRLYGCIAQTKSPKNLELAIPDPEYFAKQTLVHAFKVNGIKFKGKIMNGKVPKDAVLVAQLKSDSIVKLVSHMLKESDNLYADNLSKQLGYVLTKEGTNKQAQFAIKKILSQNTTLDFKQLELADGVGTRYNLATTEQISQLLSTIYKNKKIYSQFLDALPQSGISGTLKFRMKEGPLAKIVYAKTGSMHDLSSLSGYLINPFGRTLIFSIIINGINQPSIKAKLLEEQILTIINQEINGNSQDYSQFA